MALPRSGRGACGGYLRESETRWSSSLVGCRDAAVASTVSGCTWCPTGNSRRKMRLACIRGEPLWWPATAPCRCTRPWRRSFRTTYRRYMRGRECPSCGSRAEIDCVCLTELVLTGGALVPPERNRGTYEIDSLVEYPEKRSAFRLRAQVVETRAVVKSTHPRGLFSRPRPLPWPPYPCRTLSHDRSR